jgi:hypothetical protein
LLRNSPGRLTGRAQPSGDLVPTQSPASRAFTYKPSRGGSIPALRAGLFSTARFAGSFTHPQALERQSRSVVERAPTSATGISRADLRRPSPLPLSPRCEVVAERAFIGAGRGVVPHHHRQPGQTCRRAGRRHIRHPTSDMGGRGGHPPWTLGGVPVRRLFPSRIRLARKDRDHLCIVVRDAHHRPDRPSHRLGLDANRREACEFGEA